MPHPMILDQHKPSSQLHPPSEQPSRGLSQIAQQVQVLLAMPELRIRCQIRGNQLLVLCESRVCPDKDSIISALVEQLPTLLSEGRFQTDAAPIYRVIVYGRTIGQTRPQWAESFFLQPTHLSLSDTPAAASGQSTVLALAEQGAPLSIARHLSQRFSSLGISVRVRRDEAHHCLLVACESGYVPDASVLATPLAQSLRELGLKQLRYALVFAQVSGEASPEWILRVDLTPPEDILSTWARWGDVQSVSRLLNQILHPQGMQVSAILKDSTLHLSCSGLQQTIPDRLTAIAAITPLLDGLTLQGIHAATIYGFAGDEGLGQDTGQTLEQWPDPVWVHWHDLPGASQPELLPTTFDLAHQGSLEAITFLLTRQLNPNLDSTLETGGIRVQVHQQNDLLHVMTDAPNCPDQQAVSQAVARLVKGLSLALITGVRIYGRRSGQKQPLWHYGVDFAARHRLVPEAAPEFAASDAYVGDLLTQSRAIVPWFDPDARAERSTVQQRIASLLLSLQQRLIRTRLFLPETGDSVSASPLGEAEPSGVEGKGRAIAWGLLGVLMVVQADWILGQWTQPDTLQPEVAVVPTPVPPEPPAPVAKLPELSLQKRKLDNREVFNDSGFTQPGSAAPLIVEEVPPVASQPGETEPALAMLSLEGKTASPSGIPSLPASPLQPKAVIASVQSPDPFPTFNSRQFDRQLLAYRDYVAMHGVPDVLIVGSSRALRGVDPVALNTTLQIQGHPDLKIFNLSVNGATAQVINLLLQRILPPDKLPKLVIWADGARAFNGGRPDITYNGLIASQGFKTVQSGKLPIPGSPQTPLNASTADDLQLSGPANLAQLIPDSYQTLNQDLNQSLSTLSMAYHQRDQLRSVLRDSWLSLLTGKPRSEQQADGGNPQAALEAIMVNGQSIDVHGFLPVSIRFNPATYYQKYARVPGDYDTDYRNFTLAGHQIEALKSLTKFMQKHQISLVFVNLPLTRDYLDPTRRRHEEEFRQYLTRLAPQLGFFFRDLGLQRPLTRPDYFSDPSHLNRYGAFAVSRQLAQDSMVPWQQTKP